MPARSYPYTIDNGHGERLTFTGVTRSADGERVEAEGVAQPGAGPPMHVHRLQDEAAQVVRGRLGHQVRGGPPQFAGPGELVVWPAGTAHRWWNAGDEELHTTGWCRPPGNMEFFLGTLFASTKENGGTRPGLFDAAFLMTRYRNEFELTDIPFAMRRLVMPAVYMAGTLLGKYKKFQRRSRPDSAPSNCATIGRPLRGIAGLMRRRAAMAALVGLSVVVAADLSAQNYTVGSIDLFGMRQVSADALRRALTFKEGDAIVLEGDLPEYLEESERRIATLPGVRQARISIVYDNGNVVIFIGVEETSQPAATFRAAPTGDVRLAPDLVEAGEALEAAFISAIQRGAFGEDDSQGHALFTDPACRAIQERFVEYARRDLRGLREVLRASSDSKHRALAAEVLGYVRDKQGVVSDLVDAMSDPAEDVRNNAMRALLVFTRMTSRSAPRVPCEPFIWLLNSPIWTDRNKASGALEGLSASRSPELWAGLRAEALESLVEMARWKSRGHAEAAFMILGRMAGLSDETLRERWSRNDRESAIEAAVKAR